MEWLTKCRLACSEAERHLSSTWQITNRSEAGRLLYSHLMPIMHNMACIDRNLCRPLQLAAELLLNVTHFDLRANNKAPLLLAADTDSLVGFEVFLARELCAVLACVCADADAAGGSGTRTSYPPASQCLVSPTEPADPSPRLLWVAVTMTRRRKLSGYIHRGDRSGAHMLQHLPVS